MTDLLNIIFDDVGICLGYIIEFS